MSVNSNIKQLYNYVSLIGILVVLCPLFISIAISTQLLVFGIGIIFLSVVLQSLDDFKTSATGVHYENTFFKGITNRKLSAWLLGISLTTFYIFVYWFPDLLEPLVKAVDPFSYYLRGIPADQWFLYGTFYTSAVLIMGTKALIKYRSVAYHVRRTLSVMFFQFILAWLIPAFLIKLNQPEFYFSYFWPLKYDYLFPGTINYLTSQPGALGTFMIFWGASLTFVGTPVLTYFFGKRWYCSWVCGCGGLAETAGDSFRHLSSSSTSSWKLERFIIYPTLAFIVIVTATLWVNSISNGKILGDFSNGASSTYGFLIGSLFSGVIGVGFYPLLGTRVWCRFGCPMAAILGIQQKYFSRFRITTNGSQCISCGNCTTYCEMGIDVKSYAQQGQNIVRASCVGCGICATVCPRGVLKLENKSDHDRLNNPLQPTSAGWKMN